MPPGSTDKSMSEPLQFHYDVAGGDFSSAGEASVQVKKLLRKMGFPPELIRRISIAMYEGEINMVIHANGGVADVYVDDEQVLVRLEDTGPGIADVEAAMQEGFSTASEEARDLGFGAGMGLPNMKRNADEFDIQSQVGLGTRIQMGFRLA